MKELYIMGGGTCCGKSSIAKLLCEKLGLYWYQQDDYLFEHIQLAAQAGHAASAHALSLQPRDMWLRDPQSMCQEELDIYDAILGYSFRAVQALDAQRVLMEGAGFLPDMMARQGIGKDRYICLAPTREFRLEQYSRRDWMHEVLQDVEDKERAFANWMERDGLMADEALRQAGQQGYEAIIVDGSQSIEQVAQRVQQHFGL